MRRGILVIAGMGIGGLTGISALMGHYVQSMPALGPLLAIKQRAREVYGDQIVTLTWATGPDGTILAEQALRCVFRPRHGPAERTGAQQAFELGSFLLREYPRDQSRLRYAEVRGVLDPETEWVRVDAAPVAPPGGSGYPPASTGKAGSASPAGGVR